MIGFRRGRPPWVKTSFRSAQSLTAAEKVAMYELFQQYYANTEAQVFEADLAAKQSLIIFTREDGAGSEIVGFSTLARSRLRLIDGRDAIVLFSGDTVLARRYWGSRLLQLAFFREIVVQKLKAPWTPLYWMLISKGFKTFGMMRRNFAHSYPSPLRVTPPHVAALLRDYYGGKYGDAYDPSTDLILLDEHLAPVRGDLAKPSAAALCDPEVAFFMKKNPGYHRGDELACTAEIRFRDFPSIVAKYLLPKLTGVKRRERLDAGTLPDRVMN